MDEWKVEHMLNPKKVWTEKLICLMNVDNKIETRNDESFFCMTILFWYSHIFFFSTNMKIVVELINAVMQRDEYKKHNKANKCEYQCWDIVY